MANQRCHFWLFGARCKETQQVYLEHTMIRDSAACESFCGRIEEVRNKTGETNFRLNSVIYTMSNIKS